MSRGEHRRGRPSPHKGTKQGSGRGNPDISREKTSCTAVAAPLIADQSVSSDSNVQNVRMVCNEDGRCWRERGERHVIIRDSRDSYAPRERYIERRGYEDRDRGGIGINVPGVSVGIGTDRY